MLLDFSQTHIPEGHGADDYESDEGDAYTLRASLEGGEVGALDYNLLDAETVHVRWVEVRPTCRRQGVAIALFEEAARLHPGCVFETGGLTPDGEELWGALEECGLDVVY